MKRCVFKNLFLAYFSVIVFTACQPTRHVSTTTTVDLLLLDVQVLDVRTGAILNNQMIAIKDERIHAIENINQKDKYNAVEKVQGKGAYVMPALNDLHVHLNHQNALPMFTRYGVGLIFNLSGSVKHLKMRKQLITGQLTGPKLLTVGPTLDGLEKTNPLFVSIDAENAQKIVSEIKAAGYDGVKVYQQMNQTTLSAVTQAATKNNLYLIGHVSRNAGIDGSLSAGLKNIAHGEELSFEAFDEANKTYDHASINVIVDELLVNDVTFIPNLNYLENIPSQVLNLQAYLAQPEMQLVPADIFQSWHQAQGWYANRENPVAFSQQIKELSHFVAKLVLIAQQKEIDLVLGTDSGFGGAVPGYSAHLELQSLVNAGLSPLEAIQTGTLNAGKHLFENQLIAIPRGELRVGFAADLILLENNPLEDIQNTLSINGVHQQGIWYSGSKLNRIDQELRQSHLLNNPQAKLFEQYFINGDIEAAESLVASHKMQINPEPLIDSSSCVFLGYRYYYGKQKPLASRFYQLCLDMLPDEPRLMYYLAKIKEFQKQSTEANEYFDHANKLDPWFD